MFIETNKISSNYFLFMTNFGSDTPFMLIARLKVKEGKVNEYFEIADKTDKAVEASEPGMLHHTFDQDPEDPLSFVWSEVFKNDDAFLAHLVLTLIHISEPMRRTPISYAVFCLKKKNTSPSPRDS